MRYGDIVKRPIRTLQSLGRALRDARKHHGWTQAELAVRAGVTQATVSNFERGEGNPTASTVLALVAAAELDLVAELRSEGRALFPWDEGVS